MSETKAVTLARAGGDVSVEVIITHQKPGSISVGLFDENRRKILDCGTALAQAPPDPDVFPIGITNVPDLNGKKIGVFVAIGSFTPSAQETVLVISTLRQGGVAVADGTISLPSQVVNGGGSAILIYELTVA